MIVDQPITSQPVTTDQDPTFELEATLLDLVRVVACLGQSKFDPSVAQAFDRLRLLAERLS
jgi:hypothetical protein